MGVGFGNFTRPKDVAVDDNGYIYVTDNAFNNVQIFDADGRLLAQDIASAARGGEDVMLGAEDAERLQSHLPGALESLGCDAKVVGELASLSRGALLIGDRMQVEVSVDSLMAARREEYEALVADRLFGGEEL